MPAFYRNLIAVLMLAMPAFSWVFSQTYNQSTPYAGEGAVIFLNGDTLYGKVGWGTIYVEKNPTEVRITTNTGISNIYKASDLSEVLIYPRYFESSEPMPPSVYVSSPSFKKGVPVFYKRMINGKVRVFFNKNSMSTHNEVIETAYEYEGVEFHFSKKDGLTGNPQFNETTWVSDSYTYYSSYYISKNNAHFVKVEKSNCDILYRQLFGDCPAIEMEIEKNPDLLKFKNFMILAEIYNQICE